MKNIHTVIAVNRSPERIARWNSEELPFYEPGLDKIVKATRGKNLYFSTEIEKGIRNRK